MSFPLRIDMETIPSMNGINLRPDTVAELPFTVCKYSGYITIAPNMPAPITKASPDVSATV